MPLSSVKVLSVDTHEELKYGELGELCFHVPSLMIEYYKNPQATEEMLFHDDAREGTLLLAHPARGVYISREALRFLLRGRE